MKFGIPLGALNPAVWLDVTVAADELGYDSVWMPEHLVLPVEMGGSPHAGAERIVHGLAKGEAGRRKGLRIKVVDQPALFEQLS